MANSDKNILITPNIGSSSSDPKIDFFGADATTGPSTISAVIYPTNNGTLNFQASEGTLFSISNSLSSGSIFSVNPISGIPIIDVNADRTIALNPFGGNTGIGITNPTSKLHIVGDVLVTGVVTATNFNGNATTATYATISGISTNVIGGIGSITQLQVTGISTFTNGPVLIGSATSTGTASQPLQVTGGAYVSGSVGIGTTNPQALLQVGSGTTQAFVVAQVGTAASVGIGSINPVSALDVRGTIYSDRIGIGTLGRRTTAISGAVTNSQLYIYNESSTTTFPIVIERNTPALDNVESLIQFSLQNSGGYYSQAYFGALSTPASDGDLGRGATFVWKHRQGNNATETMRLTRAGRLGIGSTAPTQTLDVNGNAYIGGTLQSQGLQVSDVSTFSGIATHTAGLFGTTASFTGIVTASSFRGDGSQLTGITVSISTNTTNSSQYVPYVTSLGSTTGFGATTLLVYNPSSDNLGIGTTNPLETLHVQGNLLVAAGAATTQHITQRAYELENGSLSWEGTAGQLFSITNNLTSGSIFSVNDVSGIPSIDVDADGTIQLAPYADGNVGIATTAPTSRLHVVGDAYFTGIITATNIRVGVNTSQGVILTSPNGTQYRLIVDDSGNLSTTAV